MKKLLIITTLLSLGLWSCNFIHTGYPLIVKGIELNDGDAHQGKYKVEVVTLHIEDKFIIYTDSSFQIGDSIK